jgi:zinc and cadmium transporter
MYTLLSTLVAVIVVSLLSFVGAFLLFFHIKGTQRMLLSMVSFAAGALLAAAFFDILPEAGSDSIHIVLVGIVCFFVVEKLLYWYHCHNGMCIGHHHEHPQPKGKKSAIAPVALLNLVGDGVHNFFDGVLIAVSFAASFKLGAITTLAVMLHEIPQEIGDFSVLIYSGLSRARALFYNFLSALTAILGALAGYYFTSSVAAAKPAMLAFTAGGFIYIAAADLIPELHEDQDFPKSLWQLVWFGLGILIIFLVSVYFEG